MPNIIFFNDVIYLDVHVLVYNTSQAELKVQLYQIENIRKQ